MFSTDAARDRLAPDTVALMTEGLALLDHVPAQKWMWGWTQVACDAVPLFTPGVSQRRNVGAARLCVRDVRGPILS